MVERTRSQASPHDHELLRYWLFLGVVVLEGRCGAGSFSKTRPTRFLCCACRWTRRSATTFAFFTVVWRKRIRFDETCQHPLILFNPLATSLLEFGQLLDYEIIQIITVCLLSDVKTSINSRTPGKGGGEVCFLGRPRFFGGSCG